MSEFEQRLNDLLVETFNYILEYEEASLQSISSMPITATEAHLIEAIGKKEKGLSISEIASMLRIAVPTATVAVKKLERKGLVSKLPCTEDGRRMLVTLTALGERVNRAHGIFHRRMVRNVSGGFSEAEREVLLTSIKKLSDFFKEKAEART